MIGISVTEIREIISTNLEDDELRMFALTAQRVCEYNWLRIRKYPPLDIAHSIISYLAAHFCALRDAPIISENLPEGVSASYDVNPIFKARAVGLMSTVWGQVALSLDATGALSDFTNGPIPNMYLLNGLTKI